MRRLLSITLLALPAIAQGLTVQYPYSLIPGGIQSPEDFEEMRQTHASHYADVGFLRPGVAKEDRAYWVSYASGEDIYWARTTVRKGELVWSDRCGNQIRGRCGNRMSEARPIVRASMILPASAIHDDPQVEFEPEPTLPAPIETMSMEAIESAWTVDPPALPIAPVPHVATSLPPAVVAVVTYSSAGLPLHWNYPGHPGPQAPLVASPEPGTWIMGMLAIVVVAVTRNRQLMQQPEWFYDQAHVVEEAFEKASMANRQAGLTWWENGPISPRSESFRGLLASGAPVRNGTQWSWNSNQDEVKFDGSCAEISETEIHVTLSGDYRILRAIRIDKRENGITYGTQIQTRVQHA